MNSDWQMEIAGQVGMLGEMRVTIRNSRWAWGGAAAMAAAIFTVDVCCELGVAAADLYVVIVVLSMWSGGMRAPLYVAGVCTGLTLLGWGLSPDGGEAWKVAANRVAALFVIWTTGGLAFQFKRMAASGRDNLEREFGEQVQKSRRIERDFELLTVNIEEVFWITSADGDKVLYVSSAFERIWGQSTSVLYENPYAWLEAVHPDDRAHVTSCWESVTAGREFHAEFRIVRPDGTIRWIHDHGMFVPDKDEGPNDGQGEAVQSRGQIVGVAQDITLRRAAEEKVRRTSAELEQIYLSVPVGLALLDRDLRFLRVNETLAEMNGIPVEDHSGQRLKDVVPELYDTIAPMFQRVFETREPTELVEVHGVVLSDPTVERDWLVHFHPVNSGDETVAAGAIVVEVTSRKQAERELAQSRDQLQRSNAELEQFAYVASHDLQEPLRAIAGYCEALSEDYHGQLDETGLSYLNFAVEGVQRMQALIDDLLEYSRVGRNEHPLEEVNLNDVLEHVQGLLEAAICESGATIEADDLPTLRAEPAQMVRLLQNLVSNAIKYRRPDRAPVIRIKAEEASRHWSFVVQDNGIGVEARHFDRIFQVFQRLHSRSRYPGTGIGLALCKKIVERHGGQIHVDSATEEGTAFHFAIAKLTAETQSASAPALRLEPVSR